MAAASRGLPGFLRRSVRDYSEDDDDEVQDDRSASSNGSASSLPDTKAKDLVEDSTLENKQPQSAPELQGNGRSSKDGSVTSRASMPPLNRTSQTASLDRQTSEPNLPAQSQDSEPASAQNGDQDQDGQSKPPGRPKTYRETQFEKIFAANVVSMNDLKKLAWNGIPVSVPDLPRNNKSNVLNLFFFHTLS